MKWWAALLAGLLGLPVTGAWAGCRSLIGTPQWPDIARAVTALQVCEQIPAGPNSTRSFKILSADVCTDGTALSVIRATALLTCGSGSDAVFEMPPVEAEIAASVSLDIGACRIRDARLQIGGELGGLLSGFEDTQELARSWAQSQMSRLCRLR